MVTKEKNRANGKVRVEANVDIGTLTFYVGSGRPEIVFHRGRVADCHHLTAEMHGWKQLIRDTAAGKSIADAYEAIKRKVDHFESGSPEWTMRAAANPSLADMIFTALIDLYPKKAENVLQSYVAAQSPSGLRKLAAQPKIAEKIAELFGSGDEIDLDGELDQFETETEPTGGADAEDLEEIADEEGLEDTETV